MIRIKENILESMDDYENLVSDVENSDDSS